MNAIPFGKAVPVFGKAAPQGFGRKGGATLDNAESPKQDGGALDTARTVLEAANDFKDEATAAVWRRVIEASMKGAQPTLSDLRIINNYFQ
jgi:arginyl-tRNA synthetase